MKIERGDIWIAILNPTQGSEQAGIRPVIIFQENTISQFTTTVIAILRLVKYAFFSPLPSGRGVGGEGDTS